PLAAVALSDLARDPQRLLRADDLLRHLVEGLEVQLHLAGEAVDQVVDGQLVDRDLVVVHPLPLLFGQPAAGVEQQRILRVRFTLHARTPFFGHWLWPGRNALRRSRLETLPVLPFGSSGSTRTSRGRL